MINTINELMEDLLVAMHRKYSLFWPNKNSYFPPEENITFEIARLGANEKYNFEAFGECNINGGRADMILLNQENKWICHVECKLINFYTCKNGKIIRDLMRVSDPSGIGHLLENVNSAVADISKYQKFGLFVGADVSWMDSWWRAAKNENDVEAKTRFLKNYDNQKTIDDLSVFKNKSTDWDVIKKDDHPFWIAYAFFHLDPTDNSPLNS